MRYFVFVRAINTGNRRLTNAEMLAPLRTLGFADADAYQAAGNLTFTADDPVSTDDLAAELEVALGVGFGFDAPTFVRTVDDLSAIADATPFSAEQLAATEGRVQVTFMRNTPDATTVAEVMGLVPDEDHVWFRGREWFWLPVAGVSGSQLPVREIESMVGAMTMRTLGTVSRMLARYGA